LNHRLLYTLFCLILPALPGALPAAPLAAVSELVEARRYDLEEQQSVIPRLQAGLEKRRLELQSLREEGGLAAQTVNAVQVEEARMETESAEIELQSIDLDSLASERNHSELAGAVEQLRRKLKALRESKTLAAEQRALLPGLERQLAEKQSLLLLESQQKDLLKQRGRLTKEKLQLAKDYWGLLSERYEILQSAQREAALVDLEKHLKQEADRLLSLSAQLNEKLGSLEGNGPEAEADKALLQTQIREAEESGYLLKVQLLAEKSAYSLKQLEAAFLGKELETLRLAAIVAEVEQIDSELQSARGLAQSKAAVLQQLLEVKQKRQPGSAAAKQKLRREQQILAGVIEQFGRQLAMLQRVVEQAGKVSAAVHQAYLENVKRSLTARHQLPTEGFEWKALLQETLLLPQTLAETALEALQQYGRALSQASPARWLGLLAVETAWVLLWLRMARLPTLQAMAQPQNNGSFSHTAVAWALALLRSNRLGLLFGGLSLTTGWIAEANSQTLWLLGWGWALWFGGRLPVALAYQLLLAPAVTRADWTKNLYRLTLFFTAFCAALGLCLVLGAQGIISDALGELAERAFMLLLAGALLAALRVWPGVLVWLQDTMASQRWFKVTRLAGYLFLAFMLSTTVLGTVGYVNLAWAMAAHLAWLLLLVLGWYILRGVLHDLVNAVKNFALGHSSYGVLWAQDIIDPLHHLLRWLLAAAAAVALLHIYGWDGESPIMLAVGQALNHPLFALGEQTFNAARLLFAAVYVVVLLGSTRWIRKFSFRWLYVGIADIGVRNSLAAFTQYAFFLAGVLVALKTLGLDLTHLAIFTGAVGVGIGLGLQSIANNFLSGIILLLERPLRTKDLVTVAGIEGEVKDLGLRAITVKTPDNQEVIVPNADVVSHSLINWTRSDQVLRTVFTLTISYQDDPHRAREILLDTVGRHPAVLQEPAPCVWLNEFAGGGITYQIQYFVNIEENGRAQVKSQVLLALWDALHEAGMTLAAPSAKT
jgi:potassium efflux system protein